MLRLLVVREGVLRGESAAVLAAPAAVFPEVVCEEFQGGIVGAVVDERSFVAAAQESRGG
jgi:hypothetical protein